MNRLFFTLLLLCVCVYYNPRWQKVLTYLYIRDGENSNFVSQHSLCPIFIHSTDDSQDIILEVTRREDIRFSALSVSSPHHQKVNVQSHVILVLLRTILCRCVTLEKGRQSLSASLSLSSKSYKALHWGGGWGSGLMTCTKLVGKKPWTPPISPWNQFSSTCRRRMTMSPLLNLRSPGSLPS